jgi:hypothetical protein
MMRTILSLILVAVLAAPSGAAVRRKRGRGGAIAARVAKGRIVGRVVDAKGHPLGRARLHVHRLRRPGVHPRLRVGGVFGTRPLLPGLYLVNAANRAAGRGKSVGVVVAGKATSVTIRVHKRRGHHAHQRFSLGTVIGGKTIVKTAKPKSAAPTAKPPTPAPAGGNKAK